MTVEEKVQTILLASGALIAKVPGERIKPPGDWQSLPRPYVLHEPVLGRVTHTESGAAIELRQWDFYEVSVYATSHSEARQIGDLVIAALDGYIDDDVDRITLCKTPVPAPYDTDRKVARVNLDFEIYGGLT